MKITAGELCNLLNGKLEGSADTIITHPAKIEEAGEGAVCFIANPKYLSFAYTTNASVLVVNESEIFTEKLKPVLIRVPDAYAAFTFLLQKFGNAINQKKGIEPSAVISASAQIADDVYIGAFTYIDDNARIAKGVKIYPHCYIGANTIIEEGSILYSGVHIYHDILIGSRCIIHSGSVIGSDGFGFAPQKDGSYQKIPQLGNVQIEDDVEIGACVTIDRATMGSTIIRKGVKLDNHIHIAHNVEIGEHTVIAAQTGVSGSTKIGKYCMIGGQVGFVGHITIADRSRINAQSGISKSIKEEGKAWNGAPAFEYTASLRSQSVYRNLPHLQQQIDFLIQKNKNNAQ
jgi:UDP-3-O-[3-hydroxymyristoyl] glucosamine N-acyltransferase